MFSKRVILTLGIALFFSVIIGLLGNKIPNNDLKKKLFVNKIHNNRTYDLLVLGDSRIYRGVSTSAFKDTLGMIAFNMGFSSLIYSDEYFDLVEEKLDAESRNPTLLLGISPHSLTHYAKPNGHIEEIKNLKRESIIKYKYLLKFTSIYTPYSFSELLGFNSIMKTDLIQGFYFSEGWVASDYNIRLPNLALESYSSTFKNRKIDLEIRNGLLEQVKVWNTKGYDVYAFIIPSSPNIETLERLKSGFSDSEIAKEFIESGAKWIRFDSAYQTYDGSHLTANDALRLSKVLAHKIKNKIYDTVYNVKYNYRINYIPLAPPKLTSYYDFKSSTYYFSNTDNANIGIIENSNEFFKLSKIETKEIIDNNVSRIITSGDFKILEEDKSFTILYEIVREGEILIKSQLSSKHILEKYNWCEIFFDYEIPLALQEGDIVKTYIFNPHETKFLIKNLKVLYY